MKKQSKTKILIYATSICLITSGLTLRCSRDSKNIIGTKINNYTSSFDNDDFQIAAHRGFSSLAVENTKEAILEAASEDYVDYIEVDARMTLDGKIVLSHNNTLNINPLTSIKISNITYDNALSTSFSYRSTFLDSTLISNIDSSEKKLITSRKKDLNNEKYQLTGLREGLEACKDKNILLDLKFSNNVEEFTAELQKELKDFDTSNITFQSANLLSLIYFQKQTNYNCLAIIDSEADLQYLSLFDNIGIRKNLITYEIVETILKEGKNVAIWTINNTDELDKVVTELDNLYKDIIYITNYPDLVATKLHEIETFEKIKK